MKKYILSISLQLVKLAKANNANTVFFAKATCRADKYEAFHVSEYKNNRGLNTFLSSYLTPNNKIIKALYYIIPHVIMQDFTRTYPNVKFSRVFI